MALESLSGLEPIIALQRDPPINRTRLHTQHVLVPILGREVTDGLRALSPRVPDDEIVEVVPDHVERGLAVYKDGRCVLLQSLVDAVGRAFDAELVAGRVVLVPVEDFVDVFRAC